MRLSLAGQQSLAGSCYKRHAIKQALMGGCNPPLQPPPSDGWYAGGFRLCFIPLPGCFSPFPHGTRSLSVTDGILALGRGRPSFPHGSTARVVLTSPTPPGASARRLRDCHPLRPAFPHRSAATLVLCSSSGTHNRGVRHVGSYNPGPDIGPIATQSVPVWAAPRSLATTWGIVSVPRGTKMFQFPRLPSRNKAGC